MHIKPINCKQIPDLLRILQYIPSHGHREWNFNDESELREAIDNERLSPEQGRWSIAYERQKPIGYSLTEPELNIGRVIVGVGVKPEHHRSYSQLLSDGVNRASEIAGDDSAEVHVAVRNHEPDELRQVLERLSFAPVKHVWKMSTEVANLAYIPEMPSTASGFDLVEIDIREDSEIVALTELHNACFEGSWGFSPNTADEIRSRVAADAPGVSGTPILAMKNRSEDVLVAYIWISMHDQNGRIEMVGTHPSIRGRGLGRAIFDAGASRLIELDAKKLSLDVDSENPPAAKIYQSAGLQTCGTVTYYSLRLPSAEG